MTKSGDAFGCSAIEGEGEREENIMAKKCDRNTKTWMCSLTD